MVDSAQTRERMERLIGELVAQKAALIAYCRLKVSADDWHAVADAAMDIRELDAQIILLNRLTDG